jgi:hypothetical protein
MTVRELIKKVLDAPLDSEFRIKNLDGTTRPIMLIGFRHEDGRETVFELAGVSGEDAVTR